MAEEREDGCCGGVLRPIWGPPSVRPFGGVLLEGTGAFRRRGARRRGSGGVGRNGDRAGGGGCVGVGVGEGEGRRGYQ